MESQTAPSPCHREIVAAAEPRLFLHSHAVQQQRLLLEVDKHGTDYEGTQMSVLAPICGLECIVLKTADIRILMRTQVTVWPPLV